MSTLKVNNIAGVSGGTSPPITLSGDTATLGTGTTLGSAVTFPAGHAINITHFQNSTRTTLPKSGQTLPYVLWNAGTFNKKLQIVFYLLKHNYLLEMDTLMILVRFVEWVVHLVQYIMME